MRIAPERWSNRAAYATDPTRFHEWQKGVVDSRLDAPAEAQVGDRCVTVRRIGFANRPITSEITSVDPPRRWSIRGIDGPIRARVDVDVEPLSEQRSRLTITPEFQGHGIGGCSFGCLSPLKLARKCPTT